MCDGVVIIGCLLKAFTAVVKVVIRHVFFNHTHDALPVSMKFSFCKDNDVVVVGSDVVIKDFPGGPYAPTVDGGDVGGLGYGFFLVDRVGFRLLCFVPFGGGSSFGSFGGGGFFGGRTCSKDPGLF